ncbi:hypothetical protein GW17_00028925 [Ensete ventricosum]|nr:hypothetical protein GW17_00028925 [Ensete ventricosum]
MQTTKSNAAMSHDAIPRATCVLESMIWHASKSDAGDAPGRDPRGRPDEKSSLPGWCLGPDDGMGEYVDRGFLRPSTVRFVLSSCTYTSTAHLDISR